MINYARARIVVTGGGSGGHTSAAVGIIEALITAGIARQHILWIGSHNGVERGVAERGTIPFKTISVGKFRRYWSLDNFLDIPRIIVGFIQSIRILLQQSPSAIVATGGFVSVPVVAAAYILRQPIIVHEQTVIPGLANRIASRLASLIILTHKESASHFDARKTVVIGNPLRIEFRKGLPEREAALQRLGLSSDKPIIYVTGGAQGANALNKVISESLPLLLPHWQIIHQCGANTMEYGFAYLTEKANKLDEKLSGRYKLTTYVGSEIADVFAVADLVLSRSGAAIVNEVTRLGLAAILVPYPDSIGNEQEHLARILENVGAAVVINQAELTKETLIESIERLGPSERQKLRSRAQSLAPSNVEEQLAQAILGAIFKTANTQVASGSITSIDQ